MYVQATAYATPYKPVEWVLCSKSHSFDCIWQFVLVDTARTFALQQWCCCLAAVSIAYTEGNEKFAERVSWMISPDVMTALVTGWRLGVDEVWWLGQCSRRHVWWLLLQCYWHLITLVRKRWSGVREIVLYTFDVNGNIFWHNYLRLLAMQGEPLRPSKRVTVSLLIKC
jgi:hypothetical protein